MAGVCAPCMQVLQGPSLLAGAQQDSQAHQLGRPPAQGQQQHSRQAAQWNQHSVPTPQHTPVTFSKARRSCARSQYWLACSSCCCAASRAAGRQQQEACDSCACVHPSGSTRGAAAATARRHTCRQLAAAAWAGRHAAEKHRSNRAG